MKYSIFKYNKEGKLLGWIEKTFDYWLKAHEFEREIKLRKGQWTHVRSVPIKGKSK